MDIAFFKEMMDITLSSWIKTLKKGIEENGDEDYLNNKFALSVVNDIKKDFDCNIERLREAICGCEKKDCKD